MENSITGQYIEQENVREEMSRSRILAAKLYYIIDEPERNDVVMRNPFLCIAKEEEVHNGYEINSSDYVEQGVQIYEDLFMGKKEVEELSSNDIQDIDDENYFEHLFEGKEEIQDSNGSFCSLLDLKFEEDSVPNHDFKYTELGALNEIDETVRKENLQENTILLCPFCGTEFLTASEWRDHLNDVHDFNKRENFNMEFFDDKTAKCKHCHMKIDAKHTRSIQLHAITHLPYNRCIRCKLCGKNFTRTHGLAYHLRNKHFCGPYQNAAPPKPSLKNVILLCPFCGIEFLSSPTWRDHVNDIHKFNKRETLNMEFYCDKTAKCKLCQEKIDAKAIRSVQIHAIKHLPYNRYVSCKLCEKRFTRPHGLAFHFKKHHSINSYQKNPSKANKTKSNNIILLCPFCGTEYANSSAWRKHLNDIHEFYNRENLNMEFCDEKTAKCKQCQMEMTTTLGCIQRHKIRHLPYSRYYMCKICQKTYATSLPLISSHKECGQNNRAKDFSGAGKKRLRIAIFKCPYCGVYENFEEQFCDNRVFKCKHCLGKIRRK